MTTDHRPTDLAGIALVGGAMIGWSSIGYFTRALTTDVWTTLCGRAIAGAILLTVLFVGRNGRASLARFRAMGGAGLAYAAASVVCAFGTIGALYDTSVANYAVIGATAPFAAALLARVVLGERVAVRTLVAGSVSLAGVAIVVSGSLGGGHWIGDLLAVIMMLSFAAMIVIARARPQMPTTPPNILAVVATAVVAAPFADLGPVGGRDWMLLVAFGFTNFVLAGLFFTAGSQRIPAVETALIVSLDIVFAPALVWAAFGEAPSDAALVGGGVVFVAVLVDILAGADRRTPSRGS